MKGLYYSCKLEHISPKLVKWNLRYNGDTKKNGLKNL